MTWVRSPAPHASVPLRTMHTAPVGQTRARRSRTFITPRGKGQWNEVAVARWAAGALTVRANDVSASGHRDGSRDVVPADDDPVLDQLLADRSRPVQRGTSVVPLGRPAHQPAEPRLRPLGDPASARPIRRPVDRISQAFGDCRLELGAEPLQRVESRAREPLEGIGRSPRSSSGSPAGGGSGAAAPLRSSPRRSAMRSRRRGR